MIITLPDTTTRAIAKQLVQLREQGGDGATGRVLTLIVLSRSEDDLEDIIATANNVSREHPSRVLVLISGEPRGANRLDAEIHMGGDAGAAEIVVMHLEGEVGEHPEALVTPLLLPDTPVVAWWPSTAPQVPAATLIGQIAQRRITDSLTDPDKEAVYTRRTGYTPGDSDLAWSRLTPWRGVLASALDLPPHEPIIAVEISGSDDNPSVDLAAGWLADRLGVPVHRVMNGSPMVPVDDRDRPMNSIESVILRRASGADVVFSIENATTACVTIGDRPPFKVALSRRSTVDCLAEELRHLDPDLAYARALRGLSRIRLVKPGSEPSRAGSTAAGTQSPIGTSFAKENSNDSQR
ncbi:MULTISPECIES: glucose-6-phosphate dehydrogenase assembly protein OpcA [unclassified Corynebacterium]|uniref:glucose-6-phosphate dehydrogenase assembly protein OpcA n=1 Tax=unclassified Corynebacterium TaxID=2624378 RepID=UPI0030B0BC49